jgi:hypothetical protein
MSKPVFIGGTEWGVSEVPKVEKYRRGAAKRDFTLLGLADYDSRRIYVRKGIGRDRFEVFLHEGLHAICHEHRNLGILAALRDTEEAVSVLAKGMTSYLRQTRDGFWDKHRG